MSPSVSVRLLSTQSDARLLALARQALSGAAAPQEDLDRRIAVREALAGLAALPELQREALLRTAVEGHSHEQVAAAMGLSEGALRGLVYRARATLRTVVTAITPTPLVSWAVGVGTTRPHHRAPTLPADRRAARAPTMAGTEPMASFRLERS